MLLVRVLHAYTSASMTYGDEAYGYSLRPGIRVVLGFSTPTKNDEKKPKCPYEHCFSLNHALLPIPSRSRSAAVQPHKKNGLLLTLAVGALKGAIT